LYPANPEPPLSVDPVQDTTTEVAVTDDVPTPVGTPGAVVSEGAGVMIAISPPPGPAYTWSRLKYNVVV
jgi:hypothetical protein